MTDTITNDHLDLIARLSTEPGYILLCDHLQAHVDDLATRMAEDELSSDQQLRRLAEWKASRKILEILKTYPQALAKDIEEGTPEELRTNEKLSIDPVYLARLQAQMQSENE